MSNNIIYSIDRNIHGAIVIYGAIGIRQFYYYSKAEARRLYIQEYKKAVKNG